MSVKSATFAAVVVILLGAISAPPVAGALPPPAGFPDVNTFSPVDPQSHLINTYPGDYNHRYTRVFFSTPDGVECSWAYFTRKNEISDPGIICSGDIPGIPDSVPDDGGFGCARAWPISPSNYVFARHGGLCPPFNFGIASVNTGQKIETDDATCVVGQGNLTACIDSAHNHGFVLQPAGSRVF
jgi:hypothetical protein